MFEELSNSGKSAEFYECNVDDCDDVASEVRARTLSTFVLIRNGEELDRVLGGDPVELEVSRLLVLVIVRLHTRADQSV